MLNQKASNDCKKMNVVHSVENNESLKDSMLDSKRFHRNFFFCDEFFSSMEDTTMKQSVVEEKRQK